MCIVKYIFEKQNTIVNYYWFLFLTVVSMRLFVCLLFDMFGVGGEECFYDMYMF